MHSRPTVEEALGLPINELALRILRYFENLDDGHPDISRRGIGNRNTWSSKEMGPDERVDGARAAKRCMEAHDWLYLHGLVAPNRDATGFTEVGYITELGRETLKQGDSGLSVFRAVERLGVDLHPRLDNRVRSQFLLGEYELAVVLAMKEVEIRVRELGGFSDEDIGQNLMRKAFHGETGPLTDSAQVSGERQGTSDLFAGAIAVFKNPSSHRQVSFDDPTVASEIVMFADLLLRMLDAVDVRTSAAGRAEHEPAD